MEEGLFHNPTFVEYVNEYVVAVAGHREQHSMEERRNPRTGEAEEVCPRYDTISCEEHTASYQQAGREFEFKYTPSSFVCDSSGEQLFGPDDVSRNPRKIIDLFKKAQRRIGVRPITGSALLRMRRELYKGDHELKDGDFGDAKECYEEVAEDDDVPDFVKEEARARLEGLTARAEEAVAEARDEGGPRGRRDLKKLVREFERADMDEAREAAEAAMEELESE